MQLGGWVSGAFWGTLGVVLLGPACLGLVWRGPGRLGSARVSSSCPGSPPPGSPLRAITPQPSPPTQPPMPLLPLAPFCTFFTEDPPKVYIGRHVCNNINVFMENYGGAKSNLEVTLLSAGAVWGCFWDQLCGPRLGSAWTKLTSPWLGSAWLALALLGLARLGSVWPRLAQLISSFLMTNQFCTIFGFVYGGMSCLNRTATYIYGERERYRHV